MERNDLAVDRYRGDVRQPVMQNGRPLSTQGFVYPYRNDAAAIVPYPGHFPPDSGSRNNGTGIHYNYSAITNYHNVEKSQIRQGRQAAVVSQIHQNHLHNFKPGHVIQHPGENGEHLAVAKLDKPKNYIQQQLKLQSKFSQIEASREQQMSENSDLTSSFNPMKDRHMWTMWRTAVNGRIVDEVRQLEKKKNDIWPPPAPNGPGMYGKALVATPLKRFIKYDKESDAMADRMSTPCLGKLETSQFVYYGLPRVYIPQDKRKPVLYGRPNRM